MADLVQRKIEAMLPDLEHWVKQELFTPQEVRAIVKKRRELEYKMTRKIPLRSDFKRAIDYESKLLKLTLSRQSTLNEEFEKSKHDFHVQSRIQDIFRVALRKFDDIDLWDAYLSFLIKVKSYKIANAEFVRSLELHANIPQLWIKAAIFSFDQMNDTQAAQVFFQRALRVHPKNTEIWLSFFAMMCKQYEDQQRSEDLSSLTSIYSYAFQSLPSTLENHLKFITVIDGVDVEIPLLKNILEFIVEEFADEEQAWIVYAKHLSLKRAIEMFKTQMDSNDDKDSVISKAFVNYLYENGIECERVHPELITFLESYSPDLDRIIKLLTCYLCCGMVEQAIQKWNEIIPTLSPSDSTTLTAQFKLLSTFTL